MGMKRGKGFFPGNILKKMEKIVRRSVYGVSAEWNFFGYNKFAVRVHFPPY